MIKLKFKGKKKKTNLGKVFLKAVKGYKNKNEEEAAKAVGGAEVPISIRAGFRGGPITIPIQAVVEREEKKKESLKKAEEGVSLEPPKGFIPKKEEIDLSKIDIRYSLIPRDSKNPYASAHIFWSRTDSSLVYQLIEPELNDLEMKMLKEIKTSLIEKLDVDFTTLRKGEAKGYLIGKFREMVYLMAKSLSSAEQEKLLYYIERDFIGLEKIEALMQDSEIEDISCDGVGIPIYIYHRNPVIGSIKTNIIFEKGEELDKFVNKLAQRCGKSISVAKPLVGASLPDGNRVQSTLGTDIARRGSNFTIRKFTEEPMTPIHMQKFKTMDAKLGSYLWLGVEYGRSILISGGVATGKTTLLNALSLFIKPDLKVVTIEDTPELRLPHPHWVPQVARQPISEIGGKKLGEVDLFDLLRESLRQRPDYLIVGEVRGRETYVLFQQIATGHASLSTMHADSMMRLVDRLTTPPISLPGNLIEALDIIIFLVKLKYGNSSVRRISNIYEIIGFDREKKVPIVNEIFRWNPETDTYKTVSTSHVLKNISKQHGISEDVLRREMIRREKVLKWMEERDILNYKDVARIIKLYYVKPEELLDAI